MDDSAFRRLDFPDDLHLLSGKLALVLASLEPAGPLEEIMLAAAHELAP
jgi:hypothetical protein